MGVEFTPVAVDDDASLAIRVSIAAALAYRGASRMTQQRLVLASASPRRKALLTQLGLEFEVVVTDTDEAVKPGELPAQLVVRLASAKARAGHQHGSITLGADTIVAIGDEILGKPRGQTEGMAMLRRLSGRVHEVHTGVAAFDGARIEVAVVTTRVFFREISELEVDNYWRTGEPADKAGGYGIQGVGGIFAYRIEGSYSAVVGLPLAQTEQLLRAFNCDIWSMQTNG